MHYLEDYLELIEQLPTDLRERFTEMREMDLQVQNAIDDLDSRVKDFLSKGGTATQEWKEENYKNLKQEYSKAVEDAEEKVNIASQIYDLVDRHLRKLDQELSKFKMELEADNAGITEVLEQRSLLLDEVSTPETPAVNVLQPIQPSARNIIPPTAHSHKRKATSMDIHVCTEDLSNGDISVPVPVSTVSLPDYTSFSGSLTPYLSMEPKNSLQSSSQAMHYNIGTVGASSSTTGSPALTSDSSSYQIPGRKTTNVKNYPPIKSEYSGLPTNTSLSGVPQMGGLYANSAAGMNINYAPTSTTMTSMSHMDLNPQMTSTGTPTTKHARKKQKSSAAAGNPVPTVEAVPLQTEVLPQVADWVYDPNEPRYCLCNQVSYGEMVGCDNPNCRIEWFHYGCVGITDPPKGKWFCPNCTVLNMAKKKRR